MESSLFCEYRLKFYLNASHSISIQGKQGQVHPHTWEIILNILVQRREFVEFNAMEKELEQFIEQYQNCVLNDKKPFDTIVPTLENIVMHFGTEIRKQVRTTGGELLQIEGSETPTRSYIVNYSGHSDYQKQMDRAARESIDYMVEQVLEDIPASE